MRYEWFYTAADLQTHWNYIAIYLPSEPRPWVLHNEKCVRVSWINVVSNLWVWSTLEAAGGGTVQNRKFIIEISCLKYHFWQLSSWPKHWSNLKYLGHIYQIFEFFESRKFWRLLGGERCILKGWSWRSMLFKITFLTTSISIIKLYDQIWLN